MERIVGCVRGIVSLALLLSVAGVAPGATSFQRGDVNDSGVLDLSDAVSALTYLFSEGSRPTCLDAADANDDGKLDISDPVGILSYLFSAARPPAAPFPDCGPDPTGDALSCDTFGHCADCLDQGDLDAALDDQIEPVICLPADGIEPVQVQGFVVTICPGDLAAPCPAAASQTKGCPLQITQVSGVLDAPRKQLKIRLQGVLDEVPVRVRETLFGTTAVCRFDLTFSGDILIPLVISTDGTRTITDVGTPTSENAQIELSTSSTGLLCRTLVTFQDSVEPLLLDQVAAASVELLSDLRTALVGKPLCPP